MSNIPNRILIVVGLTTPTDRHLVTVMEHMGTPAADGVQIKAIMQSFGGFYPDFEVYVIDAGAFDGFLAATLHRNPANGVVTTTLMTGSRAL